MADEKALSILTEYEKTVMVMRESGMSFATIGERLGVTPSAARYCYQKSCKKWYRYQAYHRYLEYNRVQIEFPITREELLLITEAVKCLEKQQRGKCIQKVPQNKYQHTEYEYLLLKDLHERAEMVLRESEPSQYADKFRRLHKFPV